MNEKARQRNDLIIELGILVQPLVELANAENPPILSQYRIACAKVQAGDAKWRESARKLATFAPDIFMNTEFQRLSHVVERFLRDLNGAMAAASKTDDLEKLHRVCSEKIDLMKDDFYSCLSEIPIEWESEIFAANTPFTAYMKIKDAMSSATSRIHYFDRYLKPDFFDLFLRDVSRNLEIRLITTSGNVRFGVSCVRAVSNIARMEFTNYKLIQVTPSDIHDRNLIVDANVFSLGPGIDQAGIALTNFGISDSSDAAQAEFAKVLAAGTIIHES
ncbi:MAG: hypothetical protein H8E73_03330 [Planctomycetes bacterium]|nr:hypothetical protein [Planctomycetota bacterium]